MSKVKRIVSVLAAAGMLFSAACTAHAEEPGPMPDTDSVPANAVSVTGVSVQNVGAHTADVRISYSVNAAYKDKIRSICPIVNVTSIDSINVHKTGDMQLDYTVGKWDQDCSGSQGDQAEDNYLDLFGAHTQRLERDGGYVDFAYHNWYRTAKDAWQKQNKPTSGTFDLTLFGLDDDTFYGNRNLMIGDRNLANSDVESIAAAYAAKLVADGKTDQGATPDIHQLYIGLHVVATDGSSLADASYYGASVPDIHTTREPKAPSEVEVLGSDKNGVTHQDSVAQQDSAYRLYVDNLSGGCKTKLDAGFDPCAWYGYIYPGPTQLADPTGAPYLLVKKDDAGKYYVDTYIPSTIANGSHRVVLTDGSGRIQGWTPITVGEDADAVKAAEALYNEWGYPVVNTSVQSRGTATDASLFTETSWNAYKTTLASLAGTLSDVQKAALNNSEDKAAAINILAAADNVVELENQLHEAQKALVPANAQKVYRLKNPVNRKHVFTTDVKEYEWNKGPGRNWVDETVDGTFTVVPLEAVAGDTDANHQPLAEDPSASKSPAVANGFYRRVYRLYDTTLKRHFYTADKTEHDGLVKKNWRDEGIAWYTKDGGVKIYRGYSPTRFDWLFTTNKTEYDNATNAKGEGWYRGEPNGFTAVGETK